MFGKIILPLPSSQAGAWLTLFNLGVAMVQLKPITALLFSLYLLVPWTSAKSTDVNTAVWLPNSLCFLYFSSVNLRRWSSIYSLIWFFLFKPDNVFLRLGYWPFLYYLIFLEKLLILDFVPVFSNFLKFNVFLTFSEAVYGFSTIPVISYSQSVSLISSFHTQSCRF